MNEKILIVDDDATMVNLLAAILEMEGFEARKTLSGAEAMEALEGGGIDLVLLDIMMPGMDGFQVLKRIRDTPAMEKLPVIVLTALLEKEHALRSWRLKADEYVTKPYDPQELIDVIGDVLARSVEERTEERVRRIESLLELLEKVEGGDREGGER
ncbi:MAG: response regulator [Actinomycetota bacterium]|nr:response regulator [Actinomycetota bacterium]